MSLVELLKGAVKEVAGRVTGLIAPVPWNPSAVERPQLPPRASPTTPPVPSPPPSAAPPAEGPPAADGVVKPTPFRLIVAPATLDAHATLQRKAALAHLYGSQFVDTMQPASPTATPFTLARDLQDAEYRTPSHSYVGIGTVAKRRRPLDFDEVPSDRPEAHVNAGAAAAEETIKLLLQQWGRPQEGSAGREDSKGDPNFHRNKRARTESTTTGEDILRRSEADAVTTMKEFFGIAEAPATMAQAAHTMDTLRPPTSARDPTRPPLSPPNEFVSAKQMLRSRPPRSAKDAAEQLVERKTKAAKVDPVSLLSPGQRSFLQRGTEELVDDRLEADPFADDFPEPELEGEEGIDTPSRYAEPVDAAVSRKRKRITDSAANSPAAYATARSGKPRLGVWRKPPMRDAETQTQESLTVGVKTSSQLLADQPRTVLRRMQSALQAAAPQPRAVTESSSAPVAPSPSPAPTATPAFPPALARVEAKGVLGGSNPFTSAASNVPAATTPSVAASVAPAGGADGKDAQQAPAVPASAVPAPAATTTIVGRSLDDVAPPSPSPGARPTGFEAVASTVSQGTGAALAPTAPTQTAASTEVAAPAPATATTTTSSQPAQPASTQSASLPATSPSKNPFLSLVPPGGASQPTNALLAGAQVNTAATAASTEAKPSPLTTAPNAAVPATSPTPVPSTNAFAALLNKPAALAAPLPTPAGGGGTTNAFAALIRAGTSNAPAPAPAANPLAGIGNFGTGGPAPAKNPLGVFAPAPTPTPSPAATSQPPAAPASNPTVLALSPLAGQTPVAPSLPTLPGGPAPAPVATPFGNAGTSLPFGAAASTAPTAQAPAPSGTAPAPSPFLARAASSAGVFASAPAQLPTPSAPLGAPSALAPPKAPNPFAAAASSSTSLLAPKPVAPFAPSAAPSPFPTAPIAAAPSPFGTGAPAPFPPAPSATPFGTAPAPSPFGAAPAANPFGAAPSPAPFNSAPAPSPFATAPAPSPFGAFPQAASQGGFPQPSSSPFAASAPGTSAFGGPSTSFGGAVVSADMFSSGKRPVSRKPSARK